MPFLTTSTIAFSCLASAAPQADSWWHVEPDDVVIADIGGQALDIFLHGPESPHKSGILKIFTRSSIPIEPCTFIKRNTKKQNKTNPANNSIHQTSFSCPLLSDVLVFDGQEAWQVHLRTSPRRRPSRLVDSSDRKQLKKYSNLR